MLTCCVLFTSQLLFIEQEFRLGLKSPFARSIVLLSKRRCFGAVLALFQSALFPVARRQSTFPAASFPFVTASLYMGKIRSMFLLCFRENRAIRLHPQLCEFQAHIHWLSYICMHTHGSFLLLKLFLRRPNLTNLVVLSFYSSFFHPLGATFSYSVIFVYTDTISASRAYFCPFSFHQFFYSPWKFPLSIPFPYVCWSDAKPNKDHSYCTLAF